MLCFLHRGGTHALLPSPTAEFGLDVRTDDPMRQEAMKRFITHMTRLSGGDQSILPKQGMNEQGRETGSTLPWEDAPTCPVRPGLGLNLLLAPCLTIWGTAQFPKDCQITLPMSMSRIPVSAGLSSTCYCLGFILALVWVRVSPCFPGWCLFSLFCLSLQVLGLQAWASMPGLCVWFWLQPSLWLWNDIPLWLSYASL
jgi:hypothetical protein